MQHLLIPTATTGLDYLLSSKCSSKTFLSLLRKCTTIAVSKITQVAQYFWVFLRGEKFLLVEKLKDIRSSRKGFRRMSLFSHIREEGGFILAGAIKFSSNLPSVRIWLNVRATTIWAQPNVVHERGHTYVRGSPFVWVSSSASSIRSLRWIAVS